jgi:hypothetical protein
VDCVHAATRRYGNVFMIVVDEDRSSWLHSGFRATARTHVAAGGSRTRRIPREDTVEVEEDAVNAHGHILGHVGFCLGLPDTCTENDAALRIARPEGRCRASLKGGNRGTEPRP